MNFFKSLNLMIASLAITVGPLIFSPAPVHAAPDFGSSGAAEPDDSVQIYLMTVGIGDQIYARFGHTMIRVVDPKKGQDAVYNWGMFDFADPAFAWKFFKGVLLYRVGVQGYERTIEHYKDYEMRPLWQERLNLTAAQKRILLERISWNMRPENVRYPYQYFTNNCATKPRDYLDEAVGGAIKAKYDGEPSGKSWRWYVREYLNDNPVVGLGLEVLMNGDVDRKISRWDEMFFPPKLREGLLNLPALDDNGRPDAGGRMLLGDTVQLVKLPDAASGDRNSFVLAQMLFGIPVFFFFAAMVGVGGIRRTLARSHPEQWTGRVAWATLDASHRFLVHLAQGCLGLGLCGWALLSGSLGAIQVASWMLSSHTDLHHNANLWLFWPTDFLFFIVGWKSILNALHGSIKHRAILSNSVRFYSGLHVMALVTMIALRKLNFIGQDVDRVLYNMGILGGFIYAASWFGMMDFVFKRGNPGEPAQVDDASQ